MERVQIRGLALIISTLLVALAFSNSTSSALITSSTSISSTGTMQYADPPATNFAEIPADWRIGETWNAPTYLETNQAYWHNGHQSIRMEKGSDPSESREILCADKSQSDWAIRVNPGDHLVFKIYMKTSVSSIGDTSICSGVRFGIDLYRGGTRIQGIQSANGAPSYTSSGWQSLAEQDTVYVRWNNDWTQRTIEFTLQQSYLTDGLLGGSAGVPTTPDRMVPWVQVWSASHQNSDDGVAWFADAELYVNP
jgi:hypothetical protein